MMVEPSQRLVDEALESSMQMFERVQVGEVATVTPSRPRHFLLTLDGSSQDATSTALAAALRQRFSAEISILAARAKSPQVAEMARQSIGSGNIIAADSEQDDIEQILNGVKTSAADLLLVPCPFGRDFEQIGPDSAGTVVDVLLARSPVPMIVVRQPHPVAEVPFADVAISLVGENLASDAAAAWATGLVAPRGKLQLVLAIEEDLHEQIKKLLAELDVEVEASPQQLAAVLQKAHVRLHRSLQKAAADDDFSYVLRVEHGGDATPAERYGDDPTSLLIIPVERPNHGSADHANHCIRCCRQAVMVVPKP